MVKLRNLKRKKGFTLSELIVVIAIIGILLAAVAAFGDPVRSVVKDTTARSDTINITKIMGDYIERRLAYAEYMDIFVCADAGATDTNVKSAYDSYKDKSKDSKVTAGMLVFKFVQDTSNPEKSTYKLYDVPITNTSSYGAVTSDNAAFSDAFYGNYEYFITVEPKMEGSTEPLSYGVEVNSLKEISYMTVNVRAYDIKSVSDNYINKGSTSAADTTMAKYMDSFKNPSTNTDNGIDKFAMDRTAFESVTFSLENMGVKRTLGAAPTKSDRISYGTPSTPGSDIVIFYSVRNYSK